MSANDTFVILTMKRNLENDEKQLVLYFFNGVIHSNTMN